MFYASIWWNDKTESIEIKKDEDSGGRGYSSRICIQAGRRVSHLTRSAYLFYGWITLGRPHTSRITQDWLREKDVELIYFVPYSPDLTLIEHMWKALKEKICELFLVIHRSKVLFYQESESCCLWTSIGKRGLIMCVYVSRLIKRSDGRSVWIWCF
ncbi:hypothetical protein GQ43DRAFT_290699 [Delitschia confertaspora ATCC 74209]|uniref:Tc1-like transposase DDE domain-containing protein n=1 Tax=Delitschia confertaspora ATCC 74209 TaxID=1513339 RepID=A0A9P4JB90_9PLEO|nr:hypothetical protein GQ43DRAFT_290699 [Delitschia confertaspora ATCC 74209]